MQEAERESFQSSRGGVVFTMCVWRSIPQLGRSIECSTEADY